MMCVSGCVAGYWRYECVRLCCSMLEETCVDVSVWVCVYLIFEFISASVPRFTFLQ